MQKNAFTILGIAIAIVILINMVHDIPKLHMYPLIQLYVVDGIELGLLALAKLTIPVFVLTWLAMTYFFEALKTNLKLMIISPTTATIISLLTFLLVPADSDLAHSIWYCVVIICFGFGAYYITIHPLTAAIPSTSAINKIKLFFAATFIWRFLSDFLPMPTVLFVIFGIVTAIISAFIGRSIDDTLVQAEMRV